MSSTILLLPLANIPNKPPIYLSSFNRKHYSKLSCFLVSSIHHLRRPCSLQRSAAYNDRVPTTIQPRRSGNYKPPFWDFNYIQSLTIQYADDKYLKRVCELIVKVEMMLMEEHVTLLLQKLKLIDDLQRLGISYHFEDKINQILNSLYLKYYYYANNNIFHKDLYSAALGFRLLRQHGFNVSQDVFDCFKNDKGDFMASLVGDDDTNGLLQLYEASFLLTQGEETLMELARNFATNLLHQKIGLTDHNLSSLPLHWRIRRPNARLFIQAYERRQDMNQIVLELAKLDFNVVQATHQQELKHVSSWWEQTRLAEKLPFARDRLVECYFWNIAIIEPPQYGYQRIMATKVNAFITIIDDVFDVYGTLEELHLFNNVIQRWDIEAVDKLPHYMQICFLALNNFVDEMSYDILKEQGLLVIPYLRKSWADLCKAYLQEAIWYSRGYTPTLEEYTKNAWISISGPAILSHGFFLVTNPIHKESVRSLYEYHSLVRCSSMILRLADDLQTSSDEMERGDVPKSIQCYMKESGADIDEAREYVRLMICETWKELNGLLRVVADCPFEEKFVRIAVNLGRMAQYMYQDGDGHGIQSPEMKQRISSLLFEPIN